MTDAAQTEPLAEPMGEHSGEPAAERGGEPVAEHSAEHAAERAPEPGLLSQLEVIEAQPLAQRARGFDQLAEELLAELQRSDHEGA